jgi:hypothetical protein
MGLLVVGLYRVVGKAAIDVVAIDANTHGPNLDNRVSGFVLL